MLRKTHVVLAGKIFPTLSRVYATLSDGETLRNVSTSLQDAVDLADIVVLMFFGWASVPITQCIHYIFFANKTETETGTFEQTYAYLVSDLFSQIMKVALLVLAADCLDVILESLGYVSHRICPFVAVCALYHIMPWYNHNHFALPLYLFIISMIICRLNEPVQ